MWKKNVVRHHTLIYSKWLKDKLFILDPIIRPMLLQYREKIFEMKESLRFIHFDTKVPPTFFFFFFLIFLLKHLIKLKRNFLID